MNNLQIFNSDEFGQIRVVEQNGEPWFIAKDVCNILDISKYRDAVARLDGDERGSVEVDTLGGKQAVTAVNEYGLYGLVLGSRKPEAKRFKRWVTHEVIPSIRKHGAYLTPEKIEEVLLNPDTIIKLATELKSLQSENAVQRQVIAEFKPIKEYVDAILSSEDTVTITQIAADYGMSAIAVNRMLNKAGLIRKVGDQWVLYSVHMLKGYTKSETIDVTRKDGSIKIVMNTKWTQKGRLKIHELLTAIGVLANMDKTAA